jgi:hypothetical protein
MRDCYTDLDFFFLIFLFIAKMVEWGDQLRLSFMSVIIIALTSWEQYKKDLDSENRKCSFKFN